MIPDTLAAAVASPRIPPLLIAAIALVLIVCGALTFVPKFPWREHGPESIATGIALLVAAYQQSQAEHTKARLTELLKTLSTQSVDQTDRMLGSLSRITDALPTRFIGEHPAHMPKIVELLRKTTTSVELLCDVPGYGHYSNPSGYADYRAALEHLAYRNVKVTMAFYTKKLAESAARAAYGEDFTTISKTEIFQNYITANRLAIGDTDTFYKVLVSDNYDRCRKDLDIGSVAVVEVHKPVQIYFWIIDGRDAVFSIASRGLQPSEFGFITNDPKLIGIFREIIAEVNPADTRAAGRSDRPRG